MTEPMYCISEDELKSIIEDTEDMCNAPGWVIDVRPIANRRMEKINKIRSRPLSQELKKERERLLDEFKWMRPMCFGRHDATCDTRCAWVVRKRCIDSLRSEP